MSGWGLLQGLGRGISQGAELMSRGLQQDREAKYEAMREATAERWRQVQSAKEDKRYADSQKNNAEQVQYQQERDKVGDARHAEQMGVAKQELNIRISERRKAEIEGNVEAVQREWEKGSEAIDRRYERLIDQARKEDAENPLVADKDGKKPESALDKAYRARDLALEELGGRMNGKLMPIIKSYGAELKGTKFSSLLDDIKAEEAAVKDRAGQQFLKDAGVTDAAGDFAATEAKTSRARVVGETTAAGTAASSDQKAQRPTGLLQPGFFSGIQMGGSGVYNSSKVDMTDASPLEQLTTPVGAYLGHIMTPSLTIDAAQGLYDKAIKPGWEYANTRPSEKKTPINQQKPSQMTPGETPEQYFARIALKP